MQIKKLNLVILSLLMVGSLQSCSIIKTVIVYPESIMDFYDCIIEKDTARFKYFVKYYKDIDNFFRYENHVMKQCSRYIKNGPFFCIYDSEVLQRCIYVRFEADKMIISTDWRSKKHDVYKEVEHNPFSDSNQLDITEIDNEFTRKVIPRLDGWGFYLFILFSEQDQICNSIDIHDIDAFRSAEFTSSFLTEVQSIIVENHLIELLYSE